MGTEDDKKDGRIRILHEPDPVKAPPNPLDAILNPIPVVKSSTPKPPAPPDPMWKLLWVFFTTTKPGIIAGIITVLFLISNLFGLAIFGARSGIIVLLAACAYRQYLEEVVGLRLKGEPADWFLTRLILMPTLILGVLEVGFLWKQFEGSKLTREISGNPNAWMECQRFTPALFADSLMAGYYAPSQDPDRAVVQYIYCNEWGNFYYSFRDNIDDVQTLWAVGTVIHEAIHASGESSEAVTQCLTERAYPNVLREYGVSEPKIREYTARYLLGTERMPHNYRFGKCDKHPILTRVPEIFKLNVFK